MARDALGLVETYGLVGSIVATDAAAKAAAVIVSTAELTEAAYLTIRVEGELGAVQAAVEAAAEAAMKVGQIVSVHVIPRPDSGLEAMLPNLRYISKYHPEEKRVSLKATDGARDEDFSSPDNPSPESHGGTATAEIATEGLDEARLKNMTVTELRHLARSIEAISLAGREISRANKQQLIDAIKDALDTG